MLRTLLPTSKQLLLSIFLGIGCGYLLIALTHFASPTLQAGGASFEIVSTAQAEDAPSVLMNQDVESCLPATYGFQGPSYAEEAAERARLEAARQAAARAAARAAVQPAAIPEDPDNPNSIRIPLSQAPPILSGKRVGDKWVCKNKNDKPRKSKKTGQVHIDQQCCLDPDEIPNPRCDYTYHR